MSSDSNHYNRV